MIQSTKTTTVKKIVKPGEIEFIMHLQPGVGHYQKNIKHSAKEIITKK